MSRNCAQCLKIWNQNFTSKNFHKPHVSTVVSFPVPIPNFSILHVWRAWGWGVWWKCSPENYFRNRVAQSQWTLSIRREDPTKTWTRISVAIANLGVRCCLCALLLLLLPEEVDADLRHEGFKHVTERELLRVEGGPRARVDRLGEGRETSKNRRRQRFGPLLSTKERRFLM